MPLQKLEYIVTVARERSISRAAQKLFISQPSLSSSIKKIEERLQFRIFERKQDGVTLTPAGELYIDWAESALESERETLNDIYRELNGDVKSTVLCLSSMWGSLFLARIVTRIYEHNSTINLEVRNITSSLIEQKLIEESVDVGFMTLNVDPVGISEKLDYAELFTEPILVMIPKKGGPPWNQVNKHCVYEEGNPYAKLDMRYLNELPFVLSTDRRRLLETAEQFFRRTGITCKTIFREDTISTTTTSFVESGRGAAFVNESFAKQHLLENKKIRLCRVDEIIPWTVVVAWKKGKCIGDTQTVIRAIKEVFRGYNAS